MPTDGVFPSEHLIVGPPEPTSSSSQRTVGILSTLPQSAISQRRFMEPSTHTNSAVSMLRGSAFASNSSAVRRSAPPAFPAFDPSEYGDAIRDHFRSERAPTPSGPVTPEIKTSGLTTGFHENSNDPSFSPPSGLGDVGDDEESAPSIAAPSSIPAVTAGPPLPQPLFNAIAALCARPAPSVSASARATTTTNAHGGSAAAESRDYTADSVTRVRERMLLRMLAGADTGADAGAGAGAGAWDLTGSFGLSLGLSAAGSPASTAPTAGTARILRGMLPGDSDDEGNADAATAAAAAATSADGLLMLSTGSVASAAEVPAAAKAAAKTAAATTAAAARLLVTTIDIAEDEATFDAATTAVAVTGASVDAATDHGSGGAASDMLLSSANSSLIGFAMLGGSLPASVPVPATASPIAGFGTAGPRAPSMLPATMRAATVTNCSSVQTVASTASVGSNFPHEVYTSPVEELAPPTPEAAADSANADDAGALYNTTEPAAFERRYERPLTPPGAAHGLSAHHLSSSSTVIADSAADDPDVEDVAVPASAHAGVSILRRARARELAAAASAAAAEAGSWLFPEQATAAAFGLDSGSDADAEGDDSGGLSEAAAAALSALGVSDAPLHRLRLPGLGGAAGRTGSGEDHHDDDEDEDHEAFLDSLFAD